MPLISNTLSMMQRHLSDTLMYIWRGQHSARYTNDELSSRIQLIEQESTRMLLIQSM